MYFSAFLHFCYFYLFYSFLTIIMIENHLFYLEERAWELDDLGVGKHILVHENQADFTCPYLTWADNWINNID